MVIDGGGEGDSSSSGSAVICVLLEAGDDGGELVSTDFFLILGFAWDCAEQSRNCKWGPQTQLKYFFTWPGGPLISFLYLV